MFKLAFISISAFTLLLICAASYAESNIVIGTSSCSFSEWVNIKRANNIDENAEKILLREQWEKQLGIDLFYPYFKAKEVESKVKEKTSVKTNMRLLKLRGSPEFKSNEAKYTFTVKF